ncbi:hypothetical protein ACIBG8_15390 [Nonomuraea sp. NPDC050556]|uniref:hypothetical protein n=1 Tax=Nonomuraea sp. NPDC050556 TaxID=3364369 RepID=UPI003799A148
MKTNLRRMVAAAAITITAAATFTTLTTQPAFAGGCTWGRWCGIVKNWTTRGVDVTLEWGSNDDMRWANARWLPSGQVMGGAGEPDVDVDGVYIPWGCTAKYLNTGTISWGTWGGGWHKVSDYDTIELKSMAC